MMNFFIIFGVKSLKMKQYTITIADDKVDFFKELIKNLPFVSDFREKSDYEIPEEHKTIVKERINKYKNSPQNYQEWDDIEKRLTNDNEI